MTNGLLFVCAIVDVDHRAHFDDWYDRVHLPGRMQVPGFRRALRYRQIGDDPIAASICIYELDSTQVLESKAYLELQAETAADTAAHVAECVDLYRTVGELAVGESGIQGLPDRPGRGLRAGIFAGDAPDDALARLRQTARYRVNWQGTPAVLTLEAFDDGPSAEPGYSAQAQATWLLELTDVVHRVS